MALIEPRFRLIFLTLFGVFALVGMSMTIIGATLPKILETFGWSYFTAGLVLAANAVAYFCFTYIGGHLIRHWGVKRTMTAGLGLVFLGMMFFASTADPMVNILLAALIGVGQGCIEIGINWSTLRLDTAKTGRAMNLMHGAFAVGAILGPLALRGLLAAGMDWFTVYRGMAAIFAALTLLVLILPLQFSSVQAEDTPGRPAPRITLHPAYWLSFVALFLYVGVELGVSNWVAQYFVDVFAYSPTQSALLVSLFWAGLLAGRFGVPLIYHGARQDAVLVGFSLLATLCIVALSLLGFAPVGPMTINTGLVLVALSGLGCSVYYPAVITLLGNCFPNDQSQAIGFAATGGGIGAFVFPFLMSALSQGWGIRAGFATYAVFGVAMTLAALGLALTATRGTRQAVA